MTLVASDFEQRLTRLRSNVFADRDWSNRLEASVRSGAMTEADAIEAIDRYDRDLAQKPLSMTADELRDEWGALSQMLEASQARLELSASTRFLLGMLTLPLAVLLALGSLSLGWQDSDAASAIAALLTACLAALAAHSYLLLRVHQQAALAAERLSEKRVGALFLKLAISQDDVGLSAALLEKGTTMFLGHQAPETIPLQPGDLPVRPSAGS
jgi:hypothetical protein